MFSMKAYSIDLRKRVLDAYDSDKYRLGQIAEQFQVTIRWIQKLRRQREREGTIAPRPQNQGRKPAFRGPDLEQLDDFVKGYPDATLEEIKEHFSGQVDCSVVAIHHTLKRLGWRYKKNRYEPVSKTEKM
jgi:transposase